MFGYPWYCPIYLVPRWEVETCSLAMHSMVNNSESNLSVLLINCISFDHNLLEMICWYYQVSMHHVNYVSKSWHYSFKNRHWIRVTVAKNLRWVVTVMLHFHCDKNFSHSLQNSFPSLTDVIDKTKLILCRLIK